MSGSTDSETHDSTTHDRRTRTPETQALEVRAPEVQDRDEQDEQDRDPAGPDGEVQAPADSGDEDRTPAGTAADDEDQDPEARRARWSAVGTGILLTVAGLAASAMRTGSGTALIPLSYASGAVLCAGASALGARGRTRRALWLMIVGVMVMAVGDQLD
ncbi:hypothetical protein ABZV29_17995 [Streptomyces sp. NPDC005236]|uniref:hypothetical protein n=1 Tax=Streptomyces sp. NPDC005236 TaxID=3157028 RepID=UPI0033AAB30A